MFCHFSSFSSLFAAIVPLQSCPRELLYHLATERPEARRFRLLKWRWEFCDFQHQFRRFHNDKDVREGCQVFHEFPSLLIFIVTQEVSPTLYPWLSAGNSARPQHRLHERPRCRPSEIGKTSPAETGGFTHVSCFQRRTHTHIHPSIHPCMHACMHALSCNRRKFWSQTSDNIHFWRCQVQTLRKSRRSAAFSSLQFDSQTDRQTGRQTDR